MCCCGCAMPEFEQNTPTSADLDEAKSLMGRAKLSWRAVLAWASAVVSFSQPALPMNPLGRLGSSRHTVRSIDRHSSHAVDTAQCA